MKPFPCENVYIEAKEDLPEVHQTKDLLEAVYNGTTPLKHLESANLRNAILMEIMDFQKWLCEYYSTQIDEAKQYHILKIKQHLSRESNFTAFKRWIVLDNEKMKEDFEKFFD